VTARRFTGASAYFTVTLADGATVEVASESRAAAVGDVVGLLPGEHGIHLFPGDGR
jgi:hypothetical protein